MTLILVVVLWLVVLVVLVLVVLVVVLVLVVLVVLVMLVVLLLPLLLLALNVLFSLVLCAGVGAISARLSLQCHQYQWVSLQRHQYQWMSLQYHQYQCVSLHCLGANSVFAESMVTLNTSLQVVGSIMLDLLRVDAYANCCGVSCVCVYAKCLFSCFGEWVKRS